MPLFQEGTFMRGFPIRSLLYCASLAMLSSGPAFAQMTTTGTIGGTVMDQSGKALPAAM